jgi:predicted phage terminase large subunit-like protein
MRPDFAQTWHTKLLNDTLDAVLRRDLDRLIVSMPPRHGKTEACSICLPAYALGRNPNEQIIAASYTALLARRNNRQVQRLMLSPQYGHVFTNAQLSDKPVRQRQRTTDAFEMLGTNGGYKCAGVGGGITGFGFTIGIIDDPIKSREDAESGLKREKVWDWYLNDFLTRAQKGAVQIVVMTRWHEDDLAGRLLNGPDGWHYLKLPALATGTLHAGDPRTEGEALWPDYMGTEALDRREAELGAYAFSALYQQRPTPRDGGLFKTDRILIEDSPERPSRMVRYYDLAITTKSTSDYSASVCVGMGKDGRIIVWDAWRGRHTLPDLQKIIARQAKIDGTAVPIVLEAEKAGIIGADYLMRMPELAGHTVKLDTPKGDKYSRASPIAARSEAGLLIFRAGEWNKPLLDELSVFPNGAHDDQVDALSGGYNYLPKASPTPFMFQV